MANLIKTSCDYDSRVVIFIKFLVNHYYFRVVIYDRRATIRLVVMVCRQSLSKSVCVGHPVTLGLKPKHISY